MPLQPNAVERYLIKRGTVPGLLLDLALPLFQFWVMIGSMEIGLFRHLHEEGPMGTAALADRTDSAERGIARLVEVLEPLGYLEWTNGRWLRFDHFSGNNRPQP